MVSCVRVPILSIKRDAFFACDIIMSKWSSGQSKTLIMYYI